ncbi:MAG TPA: DUF4124 domain-containing protein [Accumulibacter sp.]|uniref:DUF4124 domain-containing protein n=1 Tax=Accumulibacter sp. TaxID=2053492 RepID=UPI0025EAF27B|nr:DUF4124 domain-containing protein [Accumulibacter sp.]MCM8599033.1 DUF4124 domain-containing protein [Accumulibacter sp.]MCM8663173.1 DUF4124 domain-containing protein [Accumulibacter sp.]HNC53010.1 DUF4124 domain-containing protein [Accumulibacter sp.]
MKRFVLAAAALLLAVAAQAQIYQWQDENKRTVISDLPPPPQARQQRKIDAEAPPASGDQGKTTADREMEFRKRQKESQENAAQAEKERRAAALRQENCEASRQALRVMESGERVVMLDSKGERYFLDDAQRAQEAAKAREAVRINCR